MKNVAFVVAVALVTVLFIGLVLADRGPSAPQTAATRSVTPTPTPSPASAATASPPAGTLYVNQTYKFSLMLPAPYRQSTRLSLTTGSQDPAAVVSFTPRTEGDEAPLAGQSCETTCAIRNYVALVEISTGASQAPRQWYTSRASAAGQRIDDVTVDGRLAIRVTNGAEINLPVQLIVKDADRMFRIGYQITSDPVPAGASTDMLERILASFRFTP